MCRGHYYLLTRGLGSRLSRADRAADKIVTRYAVTGSTLAAAAAAAVDIRTHTQLAYFSMNFVTHSQGEKEEEVDRAITHNAYFARNRPTRT